MLYFSCGGEEKNPEKMPLENSKRVKYKKNKNC